MGIALLAGRATARRRDAWHLRWRSRRPPRQLPAGPEPAPSETSTRLEELGRTTPDRAQGGKASGRRLQRCAAAHSHSGHPVGTGTPPSALLSSNRCSIASRPSPPSSATRAFVGQRPRRRVPLTPIRQLNSGPRRGGVKAGSPRPEGQVVQPHAPSSARPSSEMIETGYRHRVGGRSGRWSSPHPNGRHPTTSQTPPG